MIRGRTAPAVMAAVARGSSPEPSLARRRIPHRIRHKPGFVSAKVCAAALVLASLLRTSWYRGCRWALCADGKQMW
jgi:hypothetical protein